MQSVVKFSNFLFPDLFLRHLTYNIKYYIELLRIRFENMYLSICNYRNLKYVLNFFLFY